MSVYRRECRNGAGCFYLENGTCWFYHPPSHHAINHFQHQEQQNQSETHSEHNSDHGFEGFLAQYQIKNYFHLGEVELFRKQILRPRPSQPKLIKIGQKQLIPVPITSKLPAQKAWFFENSHHFKHFSDCQFQECSICLQQFSPENTVSALLCKHAFHSQCIQGWLTTSQNCPLCRKDFKKHKEFQTLPGYQPPKLFRWRDISVSMSQGEEFDMDESIYGSEYEQEYDYDYGIDFEEEYQF